ncbi:hypothetical protein NEMBOFW57_004963 [Staphylotrichum longicolle]|uniref:Molybdate transporter 1 n=1 Tax=Staphylotrichum longicolle TaxID=669026 RepID=A0AAD4EWI0_9PEZI|nr:hypothetical protein NEMBOFW57_004963 [Staphylotrichum longicolle]
MGASFLSELARRNRHNLRTLRESPVAEISGALGDLGTLLPLMIALALQGSIDLSSTLVFSGLFNIVTGAVFGIPLPVQPMKAIAASALSSPLSLSVTTALGALVSLAVLVLSLTGALRLLTTHIPVPVIKGIQLGAGLRLVTSGAALILPLAWLAPPLDSRASTLLAFLLLLLTQRAPRFPSALLLFTLGLAVALLLPTLTLTPPSPLSFITTITTNHWPFRLYPPQFTPQSLATALAQLPLTTLNSILAVPPLALSLLPDLPAAPPSVTALGLSVAAMNLAGCAFGAMPVCHGAGGLAGQHRFGARSGASVVVLGVGKVVLGVVNIMSESEGKGKGKGGVLGVLGRFPRGVLGVMVIAAGLELGKVGAGVNVGTGGEEERWREIGKAEQEERWMVMMVTAAGILAFKNDAVGGQSLDGREWLIIV